MEIPYGRQSIAEEDVAAVSGVLRGERLTQGPAVDRFETALAAYVQARHAVVFSSGTAALHAAAYAAGVRQGWTVSTSPLTFVGTISGALLLGANLSLVDIDPDTLNLDLGAAVPCDALFAVHYAGLPVDLTRIESRPQVVIEDACHSLGARTPDGPVGNCAHSEMTCFSFHPVKPITTGEGGAVTTNSDEYAQRLRLFRSHGMTRGPDDPPWHYEIHDLGLNYRLTDIQAALGHSQLNRLDDFTRRRNELAQRYRALLEDLPVLLPPSPPEGFTHAYHLFPIQVEDRELVFVRLRERGIGVQVHFVPLYRHPALRQETVDFPVTQRTYERLVSLPLFPDLTEEQQDRVVTVLSQAL